MYIWIDNTSVHSAFRAMRGLAKMDTDIQNLLQLSLLIIFSNRLTVNGFELDEVSNTTAACLDVICSLGMDKTALVQTDKRLSEYKRACTLASRDAAEGIPCFNIINRGGHSPSLDLSDIRAKIVLEDLHNLIKGKFQESSRLDAAEVRINQGATGATFFMIATCAPLWDAVNRLKSTTQSWTESHTIQLDGFLRYFLNDALRLVFGTFKTSDKDIHSEYCPAVERAVLMRNHRHQVLQMLIRNTDQEYRNLFRDIKLELPVVLDGLIKQGKFEPMGIVKEAIKLREYTKLTREWLQQLIENKESPRRKQLLIYQEIRHATAAYASIIADEEPRFCDTFSLSFNPIPISISVEKLRKYLRFRHYRNRIHVLTELSRSSATQLDKATFNNLKLRCFKKI